MCVCVALSSLFLEPAQIRSSFISVGSVTFRGCSGALIAPLTGRGNLVQNGADADSGDGRCCRL